MAHAAIGLAWCLHSMTSCGALSNGIVIFAQRVWLEVCGGAAAAGGRPQHAVLNVVFFFFYWFPCSLGCMIIPW